MRILSVMVALLLASSSLDPALVTANEPPLADAGLDQTAERGTTVYLDADGSRDPDGEIVAYEWTIKTPADETISPACRTCARTRFTPDEVGRYEVTITVTDDDGATARDTLYVDVEPGAPPSVGLAGPTTTQTGTTVSYVATVDAGTASLSTVTWTVDGRPVRSEETTGEHDRLALPYSFESSGQHVVTATVTDADGLTAADSVVVEVAARSRTGGSNGSTGTTGGGSGSGSGGAAGRSSAANRSAPEIHGQQLVTGQGPFTETYWLSGQLAPVDRVEWWLDGHRVGSGTSTVTTLTPGTHYLYAVVTYEDGSADTARFPDGSTDIEVDPQPTVDITNVTGYGSITGIGRAADDYANLQSIAVRVDGKLVASKTIDPLKVRTGTDGETLDLAFNYTDITPGRTYRVTVSATDTRGQQTTAVEHVEAVGQPEIIRSEFVNGPIDSYHPRLDPERYTAKHVLEVELNGVDPESVSIQFEKRRSETRFLRKVRETLNRGEKLRITSYWAGDSPDYYKIKIIIVNDGKGASSVQALQTRFKVVSSPPEERIEVVSDGSPGDNWANWGLVVDASRSFDPDGTDLRFVWLNGSRAISRDSTRGKVEDLDSTALRIEDGDDEFTYVSAREMLDLYSPPVGAVEQSEGPYKPDEMVAFQVRTRPLRLSRGTLKEFVPLALRIESGDGEVQSWGCTIVGSFDERVADSRGCEVVDENTRLRERLPLYFNGKVIFEASAFADGNKPDVYLFNRRTPNRSASRIDLPDVTVLEKGERYVSSVEVVNASYLVEEPIVTRRETPLEEVRDQYLSEGFAVERTEQSGTEYTLEKRVKVQGAEYDTEKRTFDTRGIRNAFLAEHPDWEIGETESELRRWTTTEQEWRDSRNGPGEFTGTTRRVEVEPAAYRYERQYRHFYSVERTGTREVTRSRTTRVPVTRHRTRRVCVLNGCYLVHESYTVWETRTVTYTTTERYTYTVTRSSTYWSTNQRSMGDEFTGRTRKVKVRPAQYKRQFLYEFEETHEEWVWSYTARKQVLVEPAKYEWQEYKTTRSEVEATSARMSPDRRIGRTSPALVWFLSKQIGVERSWVEDPGDPGDVVRTTMAVNETVTQVYRHPESGEESFEPESGIKIYKFNTYLSRPRIVERRLNALLDEESSI